MRRLSRGDTKCKFIQRWQSVRITTLILARNNHVAMADQFWLCISVLKKKVLIFEVFTNIKSFKKNQRIAFHKFVHQKTQKVKKIIIMLILKANVKIRFTMALTVYLMSTVLFFKMVLWTFYTNSSSMHPISQKVNIVLSLNLKIKWYKLYLYYK